MPADMSAESAEIDLASYFARIGYRGPRAATLDVLHALHRLHPQAIPFENLDPLDGRPVALDLPSLADKLLVRRRGGYCFEHNTVFAHVLMQLGFPVTPLIARVLWGRPADAVTPCTHMLLRVDAGGAAWLADVGFGGVTLGAPLRLVADVPQTTGLEPFRVVAAPRERFDLEVQTRDAWTKIYRFDLQPAEWIDFEVANWYTSSWPQSLFVQHLVACRVLPHGRLTLFDSELTERAASGEVIAQQRLADAGALRACLHARFGIGTDGFDWPALWTRIAGRAADA
jgi:N-hydroxyarylamine O-acetyltransferase